MIRSVFEFIRYGITGILSLLAYLLFSNLLHVFDCPIWLATIIAWIISVLVSYFGHIHFSYKVTAKHKTMSYRFMLMLAFHFLQTAGITYILSETFELPYLTTTIVTVLLTPITTYPIGKYWVFKELTTG